MRLVRWTPGERVDIPDITAMSFLTLGEFRRSVRTLFSGEEAFIIQGFKVEPEVPATSRVRVRLQPPGEPRSAAIGAEQVTAGLDHGQLIGDRDSSFLNEGPSQQLLDFVGQPVGSYVVEMRFTYTDGVSDNRAFWNSGTASEYVAITNTRHVSGWQIRFVVGTPSGGEWIPLAKVSWNGGTVTAGDIIDERRFLFEGAAPYQRVTQTASGGVEDFDRSPARDSSTVGRFRVREAIRALMRQVQDLKGPNNSGVFDWFSRVYKPFDPDNALNIQQTKTLRSIDTVTYTIGDGVSTFGDFNGVNGLDQCLNHIEAMSPTNKPERIEIVVHGGLGGNGYMITSAKNIQSSQPCTIIIRAGQTLAQTNSGLFGRPRITVDGAGLGANEYALFVGGSGGGNLVLRGLDVLWIGTTATGRGMFAASGYIEAHDCNLQMSVAPAMPSVSAGYVLASSLASKCVIRNCLIRGRVSFYVDPGSGTLADEREMGVIEHCRLEATQIVLHADVPGVPGVDSVNGFAIRDCSIRGRETAIYSGSLALIDARCARKLFIERNTISYGCNENAIDGRPYNGQTPFDWTIADNRFDDATANGTHGFGAGGSLAAGTGWAVSFANGLNLKLRGNTYSINTSIDAGAVRLSDAQRFTIEDEQHNRCGHGSGGTDQYEGYLLTGTGLTVFGAMKNLQFADWQTATSRVRCINLDNCSRLTISESTFLGQEENFGAALQPPATFGALRVNQIQDVRIDACLFEKWAHATANSRTIFFTTNFYTLKINGCSFSDCGGFSIVRTSGLQVGVTINACSHFTNNGANEHFADLQGVLAPQVTNCRGIVTAGPTNIFIRFNTLHFLIMGNSAPHGDIVRTASVSGRGYNEPGQDLNLVNSYA